MKNASEIKQKLKQITQRPEDQISKAVLAAEEGRAGTDSCQLNSVGSGGSTPLPNIEDKGADN